MDLVEPESTAAESPGAWEFGAFSKPTAEAADKPPAADQGDQCVCTSTAGAGGAFRV
jgi:uncharacterized Zn-binding protein involved in type VI secretion